MRKEKKREDSRATDAKQAIQHAVVRSTQHDWMKPVNDDAPCGPDLEYDQEFIMMASRLAAKADVQYGDFVSAPEPINWGEADRDCRRLMMRSKDIRLAVQFIRCQTRLSGPRGLGEGLGLLATWLEAFPDTIHPQLTVDEDQDVALEIRMNALQALADTDGLLSDVREIVLTRSTIMRLQVRDVERAFAQPRASDALAPESVTQQLGDLRQQHPEEFAGFDTALVSLRSIMAWGQIHLEAYQPDFSVLDRILKRVAGDGVQACLPKKKDVGDKETKLMVTEQSDRQKHEDVQLDTASPQQNAPVYVPKREANDRLTTLELIKEARQWFEQNEPSSPVPVLLKQAERLVGKRYAQVASVIPADLLAQWDAAD